MMIMTQTIYIPVGGSSFKLWWRECKRLKRNVPIEINMSLVKTIVAKEDGSYYIKYIDGDYLYVYAEEGVG